MTAGSFQGTAARILATVVPGATLKSAISAALAFSVWPSCLRLAVHRRNINVEAAEATTFKMPSIRVHPWLIPSGLHGFLNRGFDVLLQAEEVCICGKGIG